MIHKSKHLCNLRATFHKSMFLFDMFIQCIVILKDRQIYNMKKKSLNEHNGIISFKKVSP